MKTGAKKAAPAVLAPWEITAADYVGTLAEGGGSLPEVGPEVAFAGRSNVGKSTLINALVQRKSLVRTSSTPGSTRQINLFSARARDGRTFGLADLPGYGFAKRSKSERVDWSGLVGRYLETRMCLVALVLLVDLRRGLEEEERDLVTLASSLHRSGTPLRVVAVATKIDKVASSERRSALAKLASSSGLRVIGASGATGEGVEDLWRAIRAAAPGPATEGAAPAS